MTTHNRPRAAAASGVLAVLAAGAMIVLAACSSSPAASGHPTSTPKPTKAHTVGGPNIPAGPAGSSAMCKVIPKLTEVVVVRTPKLPSSRTHEALPAGIPIRNPVVVHALATALCSLPVIPPGMMSCPMAQLGGQYRLTFSEGTKTFPTVVVSPSGCRTVTGLGSTRYWARTPAFFKTFTQTLAHNAGIVPGK
jgi:hypothetical protein